MEVFLIRHTPIENPGQICYGRKEMPLAQGAESDFAKVGRFLQEHPPRHLFSSPAQRCQQMAAYLGRQLNLGPQTSELLQEVDFGRWEGTPWQEIPKGELEPWMADFVAAAPPLGESFQELIARLEQFRQHCLLLQEGPLAVVTHAGPIRAMLSLVGGIPPKYAFRFSIAPSSISHIRLHEQQDYQKVEFVNFRFR